MIIWIMAPYDSPPGESWRELRAPLIANELLNAGHNVLLWVSNFSFHTKKYRCKDWQDLAMTPQYTVRFVPTTSYSANISLARVLSEYHFARNVYRRGINEARPDCIIAREPPQFNGHYSVALAKHFDCSLIHDVYDLWPEFFASIFPKFFGKFADIIFTPLYMWRTRNWSHADAVAALAAEYLRVTLRSVPKLRSRPSRLVYNGIDVKALRSKIEDHKTNNSRRDNEKSVQVQAIYAGALGSSYDISTMLSACEILRERGVPLKVVIAGDGPLRGDVERFLTTKKNTIIEYVGKLKPEDLYKVYAESEIGLAVYSSRSNVEMPDKFYDYTAAGLAIVTSLKGEIAEVINDKEVGILYEAENAQDLANKLEYLVINRDFRKRAAQSSYDIAMNYDCHLQYQKFVDLVEQVCNEKQSKKHHRIAKNLI